MKEIVFSVFVALLLLSLFENGYEGGESREEDFHSARHYRDVHCHRSPSPACMGRWRRRLIKLFFIGIESTVIETVLFFTL